MKALISGGGTGGHIFPAISIADELKRQIPDTEILFVGAKGKMEMEKVPAAGYEIIGLPVRGFQRRITWKNITFFFNLIASMIKSRNIVKRFKPDIAIGVGGYASGPVLRTAIAKNIKTLIQEQNSFAGVTNRILSKKVNKICVAYEGMERYFPKEKIVLTGNPIRQDIQNIREKISEAASYFKINANQKTILVLGGSLGARSINEAIHRDYEKIINAGIQIIWQTGKNYFQKVSKLSETVLPQGLVIKEFIKRMDYAYAIADIIISRAGAGTISELAVVQKPCILVPSPYVAENHQTKNAMALVKKNAALLVEDSNTKSELVNTAIKLINDKIKMQVLEKNIKNFAKPDAAKTIVEEIKKLLEQK
ncbi:MAG TPA: undecaprenyldiphospho-muramoylpentapeptide beta-N-acetylglucosaminyltransferase [Bacteroidales bacterium]|nr:undecaprenyldiphospho-muramoylpentapeptide beta-N-acetylglucosaminyltransferase [Bacteroidales bacterium]